MRYYPKDKSDKKDLKLLNAEQWQVDLLKLNPSYCNWGCFEDYMWNTGEGWDSRVITPTWKEHRSGWELDEYNELVNFYFEIYRKNHKCEHCDGSGLNKETKQLSDDWYDFDGTGRKWCYNIGDAEIRALVENGRLWDLTGDFRGYYDEKKKLWYQWENGLKVICEEPTMPSVEKVNEWAKKFIGHDAINQWICVETRAKNLGVYGHCEHCESGYIYDEPTAKVALQLWYLHPRKGCSRGVYIESVEKNDLRSVFAYLKNARKRNNDRFSKIK